MQSIGTLYARSTSL